MISRDLGMTWSFTEEPYPGPPANRSILAQASSPEASIGIDTQKKRFWLTSAEIIGLNTAIWSYNRFIRPGGGEGFKIGVNSWEENIKNGFEWDDNNFNTNQFAHPYHGNLYFNSARSNNYNFWESIPFTFAGSFTWEYFYETHHPSMNDWIATSVGGFTLGEILYRLSSTVLDNEATGSERVWREIGGTAIAPTRGLTRLLTGEAFEVHPNPEDRLPSDWASYLHFGLRRKGEDNLWNSDTTRIFARAQFQYGDIFNESFDDPFDSFKFDVSLLFGESAALSQLFGEGDLLKGTLRESEAATHLVSTTMHFRYINTFAYEFGGQSVAGHLKSKVQLPDGSVFHSDLGADLYLLSAVKSHYPNFSGRNYDYGFGLGLGYKASLRRNNWDLLSLHANQVWSHAANGNQVDHHLSFFDLSANIPVRGFFGVGAEYILYLSESVYRDYPDVSERLPEARIYLIFGR